MTDAAQEYIRQVLDHVPHASPHRDRIDLDLRVHLEEATSAGEPLSAILERMGDPKEVARSYLAEQEVRYASHPRRILAFVLDMAVGLTILVALGLVAGMEFAVLEALGVDVAEGPADWSRIGFYLTLGATGLAAFVLAVGYFPLLEGRYGQTLGKWMVGLQVVRADGLRIGYKEALIRRIPFFLEFFWIDALVALFTERRQRAFDLVASTVVVESATGRAAVPATQAAPARIDG